MSDCGEQESVEHLICHCFNYETQWIKLKEELNKYEVSVLKLFLRGIK